LIVDMFQALRSRRSIVNNRYRYSISSHLLAQLCASDNGVRKPSPRRVQ